ncbi:hypothetical protein EV424DRAFT_1536168 [Suillus variegatus]|nr:hypothetical protein EV424DRAFT_1536168 [Suillus variegatus]
MAVNVGHSSSLEAAKHLVVTSRALAILCLGVPFPTDELHDPLFDPFSKYRFSISNHGGPNTYLLSDKHNYDDYIVYYDQLCDPEFNIVVWLVNLKLHNYRDLIRTKSLFQPSWSCDPTTFADQVISTSGNHRSDSLSGESDSVSEDETLCEHIYYEVESSDEYMWDMDDNGSEWETTYCDTENDDILFLLNCETSDEEEIEDITPRQEEIEDILPGQEEIEDITGDHATIAISALFCAAQSKQMDLPDICYLYRLAARPKGSTRILPKSIVVVVHINEKLCRALLDSRS